MTASRAAGVATRVVNGAAVLMYHGLHRDAADDQGVPDPVYSVTPATFDLHLERIRELGLQCLADADLPETPVSANQIMLTFDDGDATNYSRAFPALVERSLTGTFFITTDWIGRPGYMDGVMLRELADAGMSLGTHGCSHDYFNSMDRPTLERELSASRSKLEDVIGRQVDCVSFPGGRGGERALAMARRIGYRRIYDSRMGVLGSSVRGLIPRIAVTSRHGPDALESMIRESWSFRVRQSGQWVLDQAKELLGDERYEQVRARILGGGK